MVRADSARVQAAAAVESDLLRIQFVEIMKDPTDSKALVVIDRLIENADGNSAAVEHQILADLATRVGKAVGKLAGGRKEQQTRRLRAIRANNHRFGFLQVNVLFFVKIQGPGRTAALVHLDFVYVAVRADLALTGFFGKRNHTGERTRFRFHLAAEAEAKAALDNESITCNDGTYHIVPLAKLGNYPSACVDRVHGSAAAQEQPRCSGLPGAGGIDERRGAIHIAGGEQRPGYLSVACAKRRRR